VTASRRPLVYRPKPATIRRVCAEIREGWDEVTHRMRAPHLKPGRYVFPVVERVELKAILEEFDGNAEDEARHGS
jgi:hypothetical protein